MRSERRLIKVEPQTNYRWDQWAVFEKINPKVVSKQLLLFVFALYSTEESIIYFTIKQLKPGLKIYMYST